MIPYIALLVSCILVAFQSVMLMRAGQRLIILESLLREMINSKSTCEGEELESKKSPPNEDPGGISIERDHSLGS